MFFLALRKLVSSKPAALPSFLFKACLTKMRLEKQNITAPLFVIYPHLLCLHSEYQNNYGQHDNHA